MTTDEMVREIAATVQALEGYDHKPMVAVSAHASRVAARCGEHAAQGASIMEALTMLRDGVRAKASAKAARLDAEASVLRRALGEPDPVQALEDLRAAVREWWSARKEVDIAAQVTTSITEASMACARLDAAADTLRDAMGGEL